MVQFKERAELLLKYTSNLIVREEVVRVKSNPTVSGVVVRGIDTGSSVKLLPDWVKHALIKNLLNFKTLSS